ncbi:MAG: hypothetical protein MUE69_32510 [Myxococcota bacterium]|nr:hypothetical protein [Myxococcota bacterium]
MRVLAVCLTFVFALVGCGDDTILIDARRDAGLVPSDGGFELDGALDGGTDGGTDDGGGLHPTRYPTDRAHSPITPFVAESLRAVRARASDLRADVFAKIGASATASTSFLHCFAGTNVDLDGRELDATLEHFRGGDAMGTTSFDRESECAVVGWHAGRALEGDPSALERELDAILPGFAVVMYGTNDINIVSVETYAQNLLNLADALLDRGVVPIFSTVMPRADDAVAQARQVPMVDLERELRPLVDFGLGGDGIHPSTSPSGACVLTDESLVYGYNVTATTCATCSRSKRSIACVAWCSKAKPRPIRPVPRKKATAPPPIPS